MGRILRQYKSDSKEGFEAFKEDNPNTELDYSTWRKILMEINHSYRDYTLETGERVRLPWGFGDISINKKKNKRTRIDKETGEEKICLPVDWPKTMAKGKYIYNFNDHTEGYYFGWIYFRNSGRIKFPKLWNFNAGRGSSRLLAKYIKNKEGKYQYRYRMWRNP